MAGTKERKRILQVLTLCEGDLPISDMRTQRDAPFYALAAMAGIATGWVDITVNDLLLTALLVLATCIALGLMRPRRPWRWVVVVGVFIPLTEFAAYMIRAVKPP